MAGPLSGSVTRSVEPGARRDRVGERRVVDAAVVAADEQRQPGVADGVERGDRRQRVRRERVVDEADRAERRDLPEAPCERLVAARGGEDARGVVAPSTPAARSDGDRDGGVRRAVAAGEPEGRGEGARPRARTHVTSPPSCSRCSRSAGVSATIVCARAGLARERELVGVVALGGAVPVEVVVAERGDRDDVRACARRRSPGSSRSRGRRAGPRGRATARTAGRRGSPRRPTGVPSRSARWAATVVTVDLPFVPVTQMTRVRSASSSHMPRPPSTGTPTRSSSATSSRYREMPGDLTTAAQRAQRREAPSVGPEHARRRRVAAGSSSTTHDLAAERRRGASRAARPSTPTPKTPTRRPGEVAKRDRVPHRAPCALVGPQAHEQLVERPRARAARRERREVRLVGPVGPRGGRDERGRALVGVAHALEGLRVVATPASTSSSVTRAGVDDRLAAREDRLEPRAVHEGREHEVDEEALVALAAPRRRARPRGPVGTPGCSS